MKVVVIGAGASGLMCAYKLKQNNAEVILLEKNEKVGKKIYITGKGRCNVTNNCSNEEFLKNVVRNNKFLYSAISHFSCKDTMDFFINNNVELLTERGNRVFPVSYKASDIANALYNANKKIGVDIHLNEKVLFINKDNDKFIVKTIKNQYVADKVIIATGGKSYPLTGSTGDGYIFAKHFNHEITPLFPSLNALKVEEIINEELFKFTLKNVTLKAKFDNKEIKEFGEITFYKEGIAGPIALTISSLINRIDNDKISLSIDFKPALDEKQLDNRIIREIASKKSNNVIELLHKLLPSEIINFFVNNSNINLNANINELTKKDREDIVNNLKNFKLHYLGVDDIKRATVTSGGVSIKEINPKTMESKLVKGLYFVGEIIDVDAFTGGFNLQIAFSTGAICGDNINQ